MIRGSVGEGSESGGRTPLLYDVTVRFFPGCTIFPVSPFIFYFRILFSTGTNKKE
jgi:hypothetical protein